MPLKATKGSLYSSCVHLWIFTIPINWTKQMIHLVVAGVLAIESTPGNASLVFKRANCLSNGNITVLTPANVELALRATPCVLWIISGCRSIPAKPTGI